MSSEKKKNSRIQNFTYTTVTTMFFKKASLKKILEGNTTEPIAGGCVVRHRGLPKGAECSLLLLKESKGGVKAHVSISCAPAKGHSYGFVPH